MQLIINQLHKSLLKSKKTVAVAESCTGGEVSKLLTQIPGSSQYFILGVVAYSNKAKEDVLRIPRFVILKNGAVSKVAACAMAKSLRKIAKTDFGIGITGIAGPTGATLQKPVVQLCSPLAVSKVEVPVGTVFIALDSKNKKICKKFYFKGSRTAIRKRAALKSLELLKKYL